MNPLEREYDNGLMNNINEHDCWEQTSKLDKHADDVLDYVEEQKEKMKHYFEFESLCDIDKLWFQLGFCFYNKITC